MAIACGFESLLADFEGRNMDDDLFIYRIRNKYGKFLPPDSISPKHLWYSSEYHATSWCEKYNKLYPNDKYEVVTYLAVEVDT